MESKGARGFTLVELLIVVAIVGLIAAIAIPNFLGALDRGKQKRTMADLRSLAGAIEAYAVDTSTYPLSADAAALEPVIEPGYIEQFIELDGWAHAFIYVPGAVPGTGYSLKSAGKDGTVEGSPAGGATQDFDCDIVYVDGQFRQWPEGAQQ